VETEPPAAPRTNEQPPFDITRSVFAGWLTSDGHDRVCCAADWGQSKAGALCYDRPRSYEPSSGSGPPAAPEEAAVFDIVAPQYEKLVWLFKSSASRAATRAAPGSVLGLGLNPYTELLQHAGLIDDVYLTTKQSDSIFLACRAGSRARGIKTGNDKALSRPLFLEAVVRVANAYAGKFAESAAPASRDGTTPRTPRAAAIPHAVDYVCGKLLAVGEAQTKDRNCFLAALHTAECDEVVRKHVASLRRVFALTSAEASCRPGGKQYLECVDFERVLDRTNLEFCAHDYSLSFVAGMPMQIDEVRNTRWLQMNFVEFLHGLSYAAWIEAERSDDGFPEKLEGFLALVACN
jgi:hypothetical protein